MTKEEKIKKICEKSLGILAIPLSEAIGEAIAEGYNLGWEECTKECQKQLENLVKK